MQVSEPVVLSRDDGEEIRGWTLNISRGGLRALVDEPVGVGDHFDLSMGENGQKRGGKVVWIKPDKGGGCIFGFAFDGATSAPPPPPPSTYPPQAPAIPGVPIAPRIPGDDPDE